jgi:hypothetical protein
VVAGLGRGLISEVFGDAMTVTVEPVSKNFVYKTSDKDRFSNLTEPDRPVFRIGLIGRRTSGKTCFLGSMLVAREPGYMGTIRGNKPHL